MNLRFRSARARILLTALFLLSPISTGCHQGVDYGATPVSHQDICRLPPEEMATMDSEDVHRWIVTACDAVPTTSQEKIGGEQLTVYVWQSNGMTGNAYLRSGQLFRISLQNLENGPTFGQVVAGLGSPEMVDRRAEIRERVLDTIALDYPALGISVSTSDVGKRSRLLHRDDLAVTLRQDMRVLHVECYAPGSMEDILRDVFLLPPEYVSYHLERRIPWPGFGSRVSLDY